MAQEPVVYLVDDDEICRQPIQNLISTYGYQCEAFSSGEELLASIPASAKGIVLADYRMAGMSGLQLFEKLRAAGCSMPFVLISGSSGRDLVERSLEAGVSAFLSKPFEFADLQRVIQESLSIQQN